MAVKKDSISEGQIKEWIERSVEKLEKLDCSDKKCKPSASSAGSGGVWFLGFVGAIIYFWQYVNSFGTGVVAVIKACVWPAYLVFYLFRFLKI